MANSKTNRQSNQKNPKCARPRRVKRVTAKMLYRIKIVKKHPGEGLRAKRWGNYRNGMTLLQVAQSPNMDVRDVHFYVENKLMKLVPPAKSELNDPAVRAKYLKAPRSAQAPTKKRAA